VRRVLLLVVLLALMATPAVATHVQEPTAPITGLHLRVLHYAFPRQIAECDWQVYPFFGARIEGYVTFAAKPSEHFYAQIQVVKLRGPVPEEKKSAGIIPTWAADWSHQNVGPHSVTGPFEDGPPAYRFTGERTNTWFRDSSQTTTTSVAEPGFYRITATVKGEESGNAFTEECTIEVPEGAPL
jgi:hypothetical protein